jgi:long-chain fatty acid transport protein
LFGLAVAPRPARASGFATSQFGSDHGQPALGNTYAVYFNPGALAGAHGTEITADGVLAVRSMEYTRSVSALSPSSTDLGTNPTYVNANTGKATLINVLAAPFLGFATDFGHSSFRLGVASYIPFGGALSWNKNDVYAGQSVAPGAYDGPQRWAAITASTASFYQTLALAYRFEGARLGIGISGSLIRTTLADVVARNGDGSDDVVGASGGIAEGRAHLDVSGLQFGAAAGVYWEATRDGRLRFGASYTSQPNFGAMRLKGNFREQLGGEAVQAPPVPADLVQSYPDIVRAGMAWRVVPEAELRLDATWERWSRFKNQCVVTSGQECNIAGDGSDSSIAAGGSTPIFVNIPRNWKDTVRARLGAAYWIVPETEVFGSFAYETPPVGKGNIDALTFDSTRLYGTLGVRHAFTRSLAAAFSYTYVYFVPVTVTDSNYPNYQPPSRWPSANGDYSSELYLFDAAISYTF